MSACVENFNDHYVAALKNAPLRLAGWLDRVLGVEEVTTAGHIVDLDDYRGPKQPLIEQPRCMSGYPPFTEDSRKKQAMVERALGAHGGYRPRLPEIEAGHKGGRRATAKREAVILTFPFKPFAVLRNPRKQIAHAPSKETLCSSTALLPDINYW